MKQVIAQEKAWEMIRGAKSAGGQIVSATIHIRITESTNPSDFQKTVSAILGDGFTLEIWDSLMQKINYI